jgi:hypothetical protein
MRFIVRGGTVNEGGSSLCLTCRHATIVEGVSTSHRIVECSQLSSRHSRITFPVTSCTRFSDRSRPSLREMEEIAWILRTDPRRNQVGFVHARQLKPSDRHILSDDDWLL